MKFLLLMQNCKVAATTKFELNSTVNSVARFETVYDLWECVLSKATRRSYGFLSLPMQGYDLQPHTIDPSFFNNSDNNFFVF